MINTNQQVEGTVRIRLEHIYGATAYVGNPNPKDFISKAAVSLHDKLIGSLKDDGIIPAPGNVINVDFKRRKRV